MFLAVDAGNTKITLGFFDKDILQDTRSFSCNRNAKTTEIKDILKTLSENLSVENCMVASVVDELTENLKKAISGVYGITPQIVSEKNCGIKIKAPQPEKCGADRIANAYAASKLYKNRPVIVVDSGSATTFDIVDTNNDFIGGLIMPGMELQLKALGEKTSKLPALDLRKASDKINVISNTTEESIYAGVIIAHAQAVQGLLNLCEKKLNTKAFIAGTGGNINFISKYMDERKFDIINPTLTLEGIRLIYELNN